MFDKEILCLKTKIWDLVPVCGLTSSHILNENLTFGQLSLLPQQFNKGRLLCVFLIGIAFGDKDTNPKNKQHLIIKLCLDLDMYVWMIKIRYGAIVLKFHKEGTLTCMSLVETLEIL